MVTKTTLSNGIRVISEHIPHAHSVAIGIWVANGSRHEQPEVHGVSHFIEHLLFKGTERRSALDIAREIDSVGGILNAFTGREYVCYYAKVLSKFLPQAVDLLTDIFLNSVFDREEIEKERKVILQEVRMLEDTPDDYVHDLFTQTVWGGNPLGRSIIGTEDTISGLSRESILAHKSGAYRAGDVIITVAGKVNHQTLLQLLNKQLASIEAGCGNGIGATPGWIARVDTVEKELEQVHLCIGARALEQRHQQRFEAFVLNTVLGGSMSSRLFQEVREKQGLAYSVYSYLSSHSDTGCLAVYAGTTADRVGEVIEIIVGEMKKLATEPLSADEISAAKEQIKGNLLLSLESSDNRMSKLAKNEIYFGDYQPVRDVMKGLNRVTPRSVLELSQRLFDHRTFSAVFLGKIDRQRLPATSLSL